MKRSLSRSFFIASSSSLAILLAACGPVQTPAPDGGLHVLAVETFLADVAQNVAGQRLTVESLMPLGVDPHAYQPVPQDAARLEAADVLILNGAGLESSLDPLLQSAGSGKRTIVASTGLTARSDPSGEHPADDPHFWLDPNNVIQYVINIRDGLSQADPQGASTYAANADRYIVELQDLDAWITSQVGTLPQDRRLLVTNHEAFGYFAERYGFTVVGAVIPSFSTEAVPTARQLADLIDQIRQTGAPAIFLEMGANPQLADQVASETGVKVVTDLYTGSLSAADGPAPTYLEMMRYDVTRIVEALQ